MRRILVCIVALSVAGCSPDQSVEIQEQPVRPLEQPAQGRTDPFEDLGVDILPAYSVARVSGDVLLELKAWWTYTDIEARIINIGTEPILAFVPHRYWSMELIWSDPSEISDDLRESRKVDGPIIVGEPKFMSGFFYRVRQGMDCNGVIDIAEFINGLAHEDGWYECTLVYDDAQANRKATRYEYDLVSEIGRVSFPPIKVHIVDGKATEWRPAEYKVGVE